MCGWCSPGKKVAQYKDNPRLHPADVEEAEELQRVREAPRSSSEVEEAYFKYGGAEEDFCAGYAKDMVASLNAKGDNALKAASEDDASKGGHRGMHFLRGSSPA